MQKVQSISENWGEGNLELTGRALLGGRVGPNFTSVPFGSISFDRFAAELSVPGFADAVEAGFGQICVPKFPFGCTTVNPLRDRFYDLRNDGTLYDNRGSSVNSGVWINFRGAEIVSWDAELIGNQIKLILKEKDDGAEITDVRNYSVGITAKIGKKDGDDLSFTASASGSTTIKWTNLDDDIFEQIIDYCGQYGAFKPAVQTGDTEFVLRVY